VTDAGFPSLDGRAFRQAEMASEGEASSATVFEYHEADDLVWARYEGGAVRLGFLVGVRDGDSLEFTMFASWTSVSCGLRALFS
jgi:hypothetical protein